MPFATRLVPDGAKATKDDFTFANWDHLVGAESDIVLKCVKADRKIVCHGARSYLFVAAPLLI
jgi:hypothetical protein